MLKEDVDMERSTVGVTQELRFLRDAVTGDDVRVGTHGSTSSCNAEYSVKYIYIYCRFGGKGWECWTHVLMVLGSNPELDVFTL